MTTGGTRTESGGDGAEVAAELVTGFLGLVHESLCAGRQALGDGLDPGVHALDELPEGLVDLFQGLGDFLTKVCDRAFGRGTLARDLGLDELQQLSPADLCLLEADHAQPDRYICGVLGYLADVV